MAPEGKEGKRPKRAATKQHLLPVAKAFKTPRKYAISSAQTKRLVKGVLPSAHFRKSARSLFLHIGTALADVIVEDACIVTKQLHRKKMNTNAIAFAVNDDPRYQKLLGHVIMPNQAFAPTLAAYIHFLEVLREKRSKSDKQPKKAPQKSAQSSPSEETDTDVSETELPTPYVDTAEGDGTDEENEM